MTPSPPATEDVQRLTSTNVPTRLLKAAYLVGKIPFRACQRDPRVSYTLYIPPKQYGEVHAHQKANIKHQQDERERPQRLHLLVNIHGTRRDAIRSRDTLISFADTNGTAVLAPLFPAALDSILDLDNYKILRSKTLQADLVLLSILDEIAHLWPGIETETFSLVGFSGGAQFGHRFLYFYPERIEAAVFASPGGVTLLSQPESCWHEGVKDVESLFEGRKIDVKAIARVKNIALLVGGEDTETKDAAELRKWLAGIRGKGSEEEDESKEDRNHADALPSGRLQAARLLKEDWESQGIACEFGVIPGVGHDYDTLIPQVIECLEAWSAGRVGVGT